MDARIRHRRLAHERASAPLAPAPVKLTARDHLTLLKGRRAAILKVLLALADTPRTDEWLAFRNRLAAEAADLLEETALEVEAGVGARRGGRRARV